MLPPEGHLNAYRYDLPDARIARFPLEPRDRSKLLIWREGQIRHRIFAELDQELPGGSLLVFNDTRVIPARLSFHKSTGAHIEVFLLEPLRPFEEADRALQAGSPVVWQCLIGNRRKWSPGAALNLTLRDKGRNIAFQASYDDYANDRIRFTWDSAHTFSEVIALCGQVPLPPYLHREALESDKTGYQTIYARHEGAVAAPTAGLHFTPEVLQALESKGIALRYLTLHVGAGTFLPVKEEDYRRHTMHIEQASVNIGLVETLAGHDGALVAVGTTSLRTLESLYWYGTALLRGEMDEFEMGSTYPYTIDPKSMPDRREAFGAVHQAMRSKGLEILKGSTGIYIYPGYEFGVCDGLITNFHLPGSTLLLLIAAFTRGAWKEIYDAALAQDYRFLSYGDSSLLWRRDNRA